MSPENSPSNILLIVWDACRFDYAAEHARTLSELREENLWFENAIAPATWSLPSHVSLFTGEYPHEHEVYSFEDQSLDWLPLVEELGEEGYSSLGVSGNGFASSKTGFDEPFDEFVYTSGQGPFVDGLQLYSHVLRRKREQGSQSTARLGLDALTAVLTHDHPVKSMANATAVGLNRLAANVPPLQAIPHTVFNPYQPYSYDPGKNTTKIERFVASQADADEPFFVFANYMDTHRPYFPPGRFQEELLGERLPYSEIVRLNDLADPWEFLRQDQEGELSEEDVEKIRSLYAGEVRSADAHLRRIIDALDEHGVLDDTLIVVTSDHGENLGEEDRQGIRQIGHDASVSDDLLRVPLLVAHPDVDGRTVEDPVSLKDIYHLLTAGREEFLESGGDLETMTDDGPVVAAYPGAGGEEIYDRHSDVPREVLERRVSTNYSIAYDDGWKVVAASDGERYARKDGRTVPYEDGPDRAVKAAEDCLAELASQVDESESLSEEEVAQLEALGYM